LLDCLGIIIIIAWLGILLLLCLRSILAAVSVSVLNIRERLDGAFEACIGNSKGILEPLDDVALG
jgi:hypothetical protein